MISLLVLWSAPIAQDGDSLKTVAPEATTFQVEQADETYFFAMRGNDVIHWSHHACEDGSSTYDLYTQWDGETLVISDMALDFSDAFQTSWAGYYGEDSVSGVLIFSPVMLGDAVSIEFRGDVGVSFQVSLEELLDYSFAGIRLISGHKPERRAKLAGPVFAVASKCKCTGVKPTGTCTQKECDEAEECTATRLGRCKNVLAHTVRPDTSDL